MAKRPQPSTWYGTDAEGRFPLLINGSWRTARSEQTFPCFDPFTEQEWGTVSEAGAEDVDDAVAAARAAFEGGWPRRLASERAKLLYRLAELIDAHGEQLARQQVFENGKLISEM